MSSDRVEWLAAIRANPDDDLPRLAFADWLDRQGESDFAGFIRREIERDRLPGGDPRRQAPPRPLPADLRAAGISAATRRGFPESVQAGVFALRDGIDRFGPYAMRPFVFLHGNGGREQEAEADRIRGGQDRLGEALRGLFASPWLREWAELQVSDVRLTEERARWMTEPGNLRELEILSITDGADDGAVRALGGADLPRLRILGICEAMRRSGWGEPLLTPAAARVLIDSPLLARLEGLSLWGDWLGDNELAALAGCPRIAGLKGLSLWPRANSQGGLRALLMSPHLAGLEHLNLSRIQLDAETASLLARPDVLSRLRGIDICFEDLVYRDALLPRFGDELLVGSIEDAHGMEEDRRASRIRIPFYECSIFLPGPFAEEDCAPLAGRVVPAVESALATHQVGGAVKFHATIPRFNDFGLSNDFGWQCSFEIYEIRRAVVLLRDVLARFGVQPDARIDLRRPYSGIPARSYPLTPRDEVEDWSDLAEVERSARHPRDRSLDGSRGTPAIPA